MLLGEAVPTHQFIIACYYEAQAIDWEFGISLIKDAIHGIRV